MDADVSQFNAELESRASSAAHLDDELNVDVIAEGTSARRVKRSSIDELPLSRLQGSARQLADGVLDQLSVHRRLPVVRCETDPRVVRFFVSHPDVAVGIWRAMEVTDLRLDQISANQYRTDGGDGSVGVLTVLYSDDQQVLVHCQGTFQSPVLSRPMQAAALFRLQTEVRQNAAGAEFCDCTADVFISFPSNTLETAARIISPVTNKIADRNFQEVAMFVRMMYLAMTRQPGWVEQTAAALTGVSEDRRRALVDTTAQIYVDAQKRLARTEQKSLTPEGLRLPIRGEPEAATAAPRPASDGPPRVTLSPEANAQR